MATGIKTDIHPSEIRNSDVLVLNGKPFRFVSVRVYENHVRFRLPGIKRFFGIDFDEFSTLTVIRENENVNV